MHVCYFYVNVYDINYLLKTTREKIPYALIAEVTIRSLKHARTESSCVSRQNSPANILSKNKTPRWPIQSQNHTKPRPIIPVRSKNSPYARNLDAVNHHTNCGQL